MFAPPTTPLNLDVETISGVCGQVKPHLDRSVSIACWVVVFSPQIIENFRRGSADGLSLQFIIVWLLGDVFNILGAVMQGVLPTMIILAIYYTVADIVLLGQCFYYRGFTWKDEVIPPKSKTKPLPNGDANERTSLLAQQNGLAAPLNQLSHGDSERRSSYAQLSPANPASAEAATAPPPTPSTTLQAVAFNTVAVFSVVIAGVAGWGLSHRYASSAPSTPGDDTGPGEAIQFDFWGQVFGYLCAVLYLGSRVPQLLLNWRRKSTEGVSMLFFLFACLGNLTYVLSIFAYEPSCTWESRGHSHGHGHHNACQPGQATHEYGQYMLVNLSWLIGSAGTLFLDAGVFVQYFMYRSIDGDTGVV